MRLLLDIITGITLGLLGGAAVITVSPKTATSPSTTETVVSEVVEVDRRPEPVFEVAPAEAAAAEDVAPQSDEWLIPADKKTRSLLALNPERISARYKLNVKLYLKHPEPVWLEAVHAAVGIHEDGGGTGLWWGVKHKDAPRTAPDQCGWAAATLCKRYNEWQRFEPGSDDWRDFILFAAGDGRNLAMGYCRVGAKDDEGLDLNKNWRPKVTQITARLLR